MITVFSRCRITFKLYIDYSTTQINLIPGHHPLYQHEGVCRTAPTTPGLLNTKQSIECDFKPAQNASVGYRKWN